MQKIKFKKTVDFTKILENQNLDKTDKIFKIRELLTEIFPENIAVDLETSNYGSLSTYLYLNIDLTDLLSPDCLDELMLDDNSLSLTLRFSNHRLTGSGSFDYPDYNFVDPNISNFNQILYIVEDFINNKLEHFINNQIAALAD